MPFDMTAQIEAWRASLLDLSRRNRLIQFKSGRSGVQLVHPSPESLWQRLVIDSASLTFAWKRELVDEEDDSPDLSWHQPELQLLDDYSAQVWQQILDPLDQCRGSPHLKPNHVLTDLEDSALAARLQRLAWAARESLSEQGVATLYVAFGFLRWLDLSDREEVRSPLLLVPVGLERDHCEDPWRLVSIEEEILPNHSLAQLMNRDFKLRLPDLEEHGDIDDPAWRLAYFNAIRQAITHYPDWQIVDEVALGVFHFQKLAMWEDLGRNVDRIVQHDVCRAIGGDAKALRPPPAPQQ